MKEREKIRYRLSINHLSFAWLIDMLRKRGIETNGPVLSAILAGTRNGPSVDKIIAESMSDILTTIAAVEWIVVGCLFLWRLRHWNRRFSELYDELRKEIDRE